MTKVNKYEYVYVIQGNYGHGWEDLTAESKAREARARLREYRQADPGTPHRKIMRREPNPAYRAA